MDPSKVERDPRKCAKTSKRSGRPCKNWAIKGHTVCRNHGGSAPQVKAAAARNVLEGTIQARLRKMMSAATPVTDPLSALQQHAGKVQQWMQFLEDQVEELRHDSQWSTEQINGVVELYTRAMSETRQTLKDIASLKIDERLIAIEQGKVQMLFDALKAGLVAGGITGPGPTQAAFSAAERRLRVVREEPRQEIETGKAAGY